VFIMPPARCPPGDTPVTALQVKGGGTPPEVWDGVLDARAQVPRTQKEKEKEKEEEEEKKEDARDRILGFCQKFGAVTIL
jgi:hypothetical protein